MLTRYIGNYTVYMQGHQLNYYDVFNEEARNALWGYMKKGLFDLGVDAWWLDATEPNLGSIQGAFHLYRTCKGPAAKHVNAYPLMHAKGIYENQRKTSDRKRVFMLSRTGFAGQQRYGSAVWSGDTYHTWDVLKRQISAGIHYCLSGLPYWTTDIGGFYGGDCADPWYREIYLRWFQFGAFCPIFRVHGTQIPREIWQFGEKAESIMHDYLVFRYRLMPYIYSIAWKVTHENYTMMRGLIMDFRRDGKALKVDDQYMFGPSVMVCPVCEEGAKQRSVYLPESNGWYDLWTGQYFEPKQTIQANAPIEKIPLFVKAGSIIPIGPSLQHVAEKPADPVEIRVYGGADASFNLYEDEGDTYNYEKGLYSEILFEWSDDRKELVIGERKGEFDGMLEKRTFQIVLINQNREAGYYDQVQFDQIIEYSGKRVCCPFI